MSEIETNNPFLEELIIGLHTVASIPTECPSDPRNGETGHNTERNAYALEAISHGLAAVTFEVSQLRDEQQTANLFSLYKSSLFDRLNDAERLEVENQILERLGVRDA